MKRIDFSYNWNNKLDCKAFTTLRLSGRHQVGERLAIWLKEKKGKESQKGIAEVIGKKRLTLAQISEYIAYLDTGYSAKECQDIIKRMYRKVEDWDTRPIYFYLLKYV